MRVILFVFFLAASLGCDLECILNTTVFYLKDIRKAGKFLDQEYDFLLENITCSNIQVSDLNSEVQPSFQIHSSASLNKIECNANWKASLGLLKNENGFVRASVSSRDTFSSSVALIKNMTTKLLEQAEVVLCSSLFHVVLDQFDSSKKWVKDLEKLLQNELEKIIDRELEKAVCDSYRSFNETNITSMLKRVNDRMFLKRTIVGGDVGPPGAASLLENSVVSFLKFLTTRIFSAEVINSAVRDYVGGTDLDLGHGLVVRGLDTFEQVDLFVPEKKYLLDFGVKLKHANVSLEFNITEGWNAVMYARMSNISATSVLRVIANRSFFEGLTWNEITNLRCPVNGIDSLSMEELELGANIGQIELISSVNASLETSLVRFFNQLLVLAVEEYDPFIPDILYAFLSPSIIDVFNSNTLLNTSMSNCAYSGFAEKPVELNRDIVIASSVLWSVVLIVLFIVALLKKEGTALAFSVDNPSRFLGNSSHVYAIRRQTFLFRFANFGFFVFFVFSFQNSLRI